MYLDDVILYIHVLCEAAIVSQLCISFPYSLHGLCEDYLTCDISYNAVMPLSRASTRGRYSRIMGVTPPLATTKLGGVPWYRITITSIFTVFLSSILFDNVLI